MAQGDISTTFTITVPSGANYPGGTAGSTTQGKPGTVTR